MNLLKMYSLLKMGIFQPAMFDYRSVDECCWTMFWLSEGWGQVKILLTQIIRYHPDLNPEPEFQFYCFHTSKPTSCGQKSHKFTTSSSKNPYNFCRSACLLAPPVTASRSHILRCHGAGPTHNWQKTATLEFLKFGVLLQAPGIRFDILIYIIMSSRQN